MDQSSVQQNPRAGDHAFKDRWREFTENLVHIHSDVQTTLLSPTNADDYFSPDIIISAKLNLRFFNYVPSLLTSLGILGTFLGLTLGLGPIAGIIGDNISPATMKEPIGQLIGGMVFAFSTSVWGIGLGLLFSLIEKKMIHNLIQKAQRLSDRINELFPQIIAEQVLVKLKDEVSEQTSSLKAFSVDLANGIRDNFTDVIRTHLVPHLASQKSATDALANSVREQTSAIQDLGSQSIQTILEQFGTALLAGAGEEFNALQTSLAATVESIDGLEGKFQGMLDGLKTEGKANIEALSKFTEDQLKHSISTYNDLSNSTKGILDRSRTLADRLDQVIEGLGPILEDISRNSSALQKSSSSLIENLDQTLAAAKLFQDAASKIESGAQALQNLPPALEIHVTTMTDAASRLENVLNGTNQLLSGFDGIRAQLENVFQQFDAGLTQYAVATRDSLQKYLQDFENQFSTISGALKSMLEDVEEPLDKLPEQLVGYRRR